MPPRKAGEAHLAATSSRDNGDRFCGSPDRLARLHDLVPIADLCLARGHLDRAAGAIPGVDALGFAPGADSVHRPLGGPAHVERRRVAHAVAQDRQIVPERRDEAAVPPARPVAGEPCLEHDDVEPGLELLQPPGRPEPQVAASDDDDVCSRVARERPGRLDGPRFLEPVAVARVPHAPILRGPRRRERETPLSRRRRTIDSREGALTGNRKVPCFRGSRVPGSALADRGTAGGAGSLLQGFSRSGIGVSRSRNCGLGQSARADPPTAAQIPRWRTGPEPATTGITIRSRASRHLLGYRVQPFLAVRNHVVSARLRLVVATGLPSVLCSRFRRRDVSLSPRQWYARLGEGSTRAAIEAARPIHGLAASVSTV